MQTIYHANDLQELTNISEHVRGCKHYKNPSLGVGTTQTERLGEGATQNDLCEEENCSNYPQCCTDNAEAEIDCVSGDHIHMIAEGQTDEGGCMRAGHHCCCTAEPAEEVAMQTELCKCNHQMKCMHWALTSYFQGLWLAEAALLSSVQAEYREAQLSFNFRYPRNQAAGSKLYPDPMFFYCNAGFPFDLWTHVALLYIQLHQSTLSLLLLFQSWWEVGLPTDLSRGPRSSPLLRWFFLNSCYFTAMITCTYI